ncbi:MAG: alpha/beta hydrolase [Clostridiales Family XIII bacterium]|nr:alpha/beta hydrolase [Clostridia bacterium]MDY3012774.1 alpha/beta hydrolase [Clostridiales Family XIII bacterium]
MKSIYRNEIARKAVLDLYDAQLQELNRSYKDLYVETSFGKTHLIETGDFSAKPLLLFHGGNATTAYNLKYCQFLLDNFHIYAVDTIGHPGKSEETCLSPANQDYGRWASQVITQLGFEKIACFGGSFGAGVLVKTMCVSPEKVERSALVVPSAIKNAPAYKSMSMLLPMILYWITHKEEWFIKCLLPMAVTRENISDDILATARCSIDNAKIKTGMPKDESEEHLKRFKNPVLIMAAEKNCLFPGNQVIRQAKKVWKQCQTYLLAGRGHIHELIDEEKNQILKFLLS